MTQLRNAKAAGLNNIPAEAFKADIETAKIWEEEQVLSDWKEGYLIKTPMNRDLSNSAHYGGITSKQF